MNSSPPLDVELLASTPGIAEAPCWVDGELWFTDLTIGVLRRRSDGEVTTVAAGRRGVGGLVPHLAGGVVASGRSLVHVSADGSVTELVDRPPGTTGLNDLHTTPEGAVLAGALRYRPLAGDESRPGVLLRVDDSGLHEVANGPAWPNGIGTPPVPDGRTYLADFATGSVLEVAADGDLSLLATLDEGHADGLAVDTDGRIWVATGPGRTVVALLPDGRVDQRWSVPADFVASIALPPSGGPAVLAVAGLPDGTGGLLAAELGVMGVPIHAATLRRL